MIAILDYGMGNLYSIRNAFEKVGADVSVSSKTKDLRDADGIVVPGVGSFDQAMKKIAPMKEDLADIVNSGTPFMGICLGMQILFDESEEGREKGLGIIPGKVVRLPSTVLSPQIGWNELRIRRNTGLLDGISDGDFFYFVHSYYCNPKDRSIISASTDYGIEMTAVIVKDNVCAFQFHPEKSGRKGLLLLENFLGGVKC